MKTATLEVLEPEEKVFGSKTAGSYFVREFVDGEHMGGSFFKTEKEAKNYIKKVDVIKFVVKPSGGRIVPGTTRTIKSNDNP